MKFLIAPWSGWEETYFEREKALERAKELIEKDVEEIRTKHGYRTPEHLIDEKWDFLEEMYEYLDNPSIPS